MKLKFQKYYFLPRYIFEWVEKPALDLGVMVFHKNETIPNAAIKNNCYIHIPHVDVHQYTFKMDGNHDTE